jgi:hypothetical protein
MEDRKIYVIMTSEGKVIDAGLGASSKDFMARFRKRAVLSRYVLDHTKVVRAWVAPEDRQWEGAKGCICERCTAETPTKQFIREAGLKKRKNS